MQIVIDISPLTHQCIEKGYRTADVAEELFTAVQSGTLLPEGHGDLVDRDVAIDQLGNLDGFGVLGRCIDEIPYVVEADKGQEDGNAD